MYFFKQMVESCFSFLEPNFVLILELMVEKKCWKKYTENIWVNLVVVNFMDFMISWAEIAENLT